MHTPTEFEIETQGLSKEFSGFSAVKNVSLKVRRGSIHALLGPNGAGKTTLLNGLLGIVDPAERIVCVEDAPELRPQHPHTVRLVARAANTEGAGEVPLRALVRQALRMRPDRIVVGEVRGAEVVDLLAEDISWEKWRHYLRGALDHAESMPDDAPTPGIAQIVADQMLTEAQVQTIVDERAIWGRPSGVTA